MAAMSCFERIGSTPTGQGVERHSALDLTKELRVGIDALSVQRLPGQGDNLGWHL
jgi:hypothetical protein